MKTTELFVEQTLTGFLILAAGAAPFLSWDKLQKLPGEAKGGFPQVDPAEVTCRSFAASAPTRC